MLPTPARHAIEMTLAACYGQVRTWDVPPTTRVGLAVQCPKVSKSWLDRLSRRSRPLTSIRLEYQGCFPVESGVVGLFLLRSRSNLILISRYNDSAR